MPLSPLQQNEGSNAEIVEAEIQPSYTYGFDFEKGEFTGDMIDEEDALHQFIQKAILTARFRFLIYDDDFGSEIDTLISEDLPFDMTATEVERMIKEALIYDERIASLSRFSVTRTGDKLYVSFVVTTNQGNVLNEEVIL